MIDTLIVLLILTFLVGSFSLLRPSADERRRVRLRRHAARQGLRIESIMGDTRALFEARGEGGLLFLYWMPWEAAAGFDREELPVNAVRIGDAAEAGVTSGAEHLPTLPDGFRGWLVDQRGLGFVWDELAAGNDLDRAIAAVKRGISAGPSTF